MPGVVRLVVFSLGVAVVAGNVSFVGKSFLVWQELVLVVGVFVFVFLFFFHVVLHSFDRRIQNQRVTIDMARPSPSPVQWYD